MTSANNTGAIEQTARRHATIRPDLLIFGLQ
jgi:hypothetical protein